MKNTSRMLVGTAILFSTAAFVGACKNGGNNNADTTSAAGAVGASTGAMAPAPGMGASTGAMPPAAGASTGAMGASTGAMPESTETKKSEKYERTHKKTHHKR